MKTFFSALLSSVLLSALTLTANAAPKSPDQLRLTVDVMKPKIDQPIPAIYPPKFISELNMKVFAYEGCEATAKVESYESIGHVDSELMATARVLVQATCLEAAFLVKERYENFFWNDGTRMYQVHLPPVPVIGGVTGSN